MTKHILQTKHIIDYLSSNQQKKIKEETNWVFCRPIRFYADADFNYFSPSTQMSIRLSPWGPAHLETP